MDPQLSYIVNGQGNGGIATRLLAANGDVGVLRPFIGDDGHSYMTVNTGRRDENGEPIYQTMQCNVAATLMKEEWIQFDQTVVRVARPLLRLWADLAAANTYTVPNGMGKTVIQHQSMTDAGEAALSMDGMRETNRDRPHFDLINMPLPIVHSDFSFSMREIMVSRNSGNPLDTTMIEQGTRRCVETIERLVAGTTTFPAYGGGNIYGYTNHPNRVTKTITSPAVAANGWVPQTLVSEILDMIQSLNNIYFGGPYILYHSPGWSKYLDDDYSAAYGGKTLRQRIQDIGDITAVRKAEYLSNYQMVLVQMTSDVARAVDGLDLQTIQWETHGGMQINFKILGIKVPQLRATADSTTGICHATAA